MATRDLDGDARRVFRVGAWWCYGIAALIGVEGATWVLILAWGDHADMLALAYVVWVIEATVFLVLGVLVRRNSWWAAMVGAAIALLFGILMAGSVVEDMQMLVGQIRAASVLKDVGVGAGVNVLFNTAIAGATGVLVYWLVRCVRIPRDRLRRAGVRGFEVVARDGGTAPRDAPGKPGG